MNNKNNKLDVERDIDEFAERINVLSKRYGSVSKIARICGFSEGVVRSWRDGRSDPSRARCVALAKGLGISLMWVVAGEGPMQNEGEQDRTPPSMANISAKPMDPKRLSAAVEILESTLRLAGADPSIARNSDLLADYYELLGHTDPVQRAKIASVLNQRVMDRVRSPSGLQHNEKAV
ncbi:transcriptional regulator [Oleiagrimonas soli]|uniref:HTH cro/C1-type domain-containing protein n=1 Tax=Oleiagrimonas soli TaxID=1543381 RepID=A0A099CS77_9GAMM|nr:transcriptional regulator [Oleiagrimonas soli]KGI76609.1 hypothetical protein LF63_0114990 [Oleiagrimonas soli]MBB6184908.1 hypothetical protein [Oleiagrimonas soli]